MDMIMLMCEDMALESGGRVHIGCARGIGNGVVRVHGFFGCTELSLRHLEHACACDRACLRLRGSRSDSKKFK